MLATVLLAKQTTDALPTGDAMSQSMLMQYTGFESKVKGREYAFQVRFAAEDVREFTVTISVEAFDSRLVRFQDAPDVCSLRLKRELIANTELPSNTNFLVTESELEEYKSRHTTKVDKWRQRPS
jgi:hypothetical protein